MPQKKIYVADIGEVTLIKRRRATHLRINISASGQARVSLPYGVPFLMAQNFVKGHKTWILEQLSQRQQPLISQGCRIGKAHQVYFLRPRTLAKAGAIRSKLTHTDIQLFSSLQTDHPKLQDKARQACEKALLMEAERLLPQRLETLAKKHGLKYKKIKVRKLSSRWGSCSREGSLTLNYYLMQLPWHLVDYVILHELNHLQHLNHSPAFWQSLEKMNSHTREYKKQLKLHSPRLEPVLA